VRLVNCSVAQRGFRMASKSITERTRKSADDEETYTLIDPHWVARKQLPTFRIPTDQDVSSANGSQWLEDMNVLISYYSNILTDPFDMFWAKKHQKSLALSIHSFLEHCPRDTEHLAISSRFLDPISHLYALVLLILLRASKSAESEDMFLRPFEHENIIYDGAVFDIPCLIDLAVLYGNGSPDIVSTILRSVLGAGGKFANDAVSVICRATTTFEQVEKRVMEWQFDDRHQFTSSNADAVDIVSKTIDYITDAERSLGIFLTFLGPINPSIAELCIQKNVVSSLANFYNTTILTIRDHILRSMTWSTETKTMLLNKLAIAAAALVKMVRVGFVEPGLVHRIMQMTFDGPDASCNQSLMGASNTLIGVMVDMLNYPDFATAYARLYPVNDDIILIRENSTSANLGRDQLDYLYSAFSRLIEESLTKIANSDGTKEVVPPSVEEMLRDTVDEQPQPGCSRPPEFRTVKAVLPGTDDDLIERCLEHYNSDSQSVITALLDGSVPLSVSNADYAEPVTQYKPGQLWQGKRQNDATIQPLSKEERERISRLAVSVWDDDDNCENGSDAENGEKDASGFFEKRQADLTYDDEYDDTYDVEVGTKLEPLAEEEAENVEFGDAFDQPEKPHCRASPARGESRADRGKHRYRQEHFDQQSRQNVLPIENPEDARLRRQQTAVNRAMRNDRNRGAKRSEVPFQPTPPKFETKLSSRALDEVSDSRRDISTKTGSSTQQGRDSCRPDRARGHPKNRGGGRGRASGRGGGDTYAFRLKERFGTYDR
ncbi:Activating signal cointegrator 1 complex subunit 2, partial [Taenia solium]